MARPNKVPYYVMETSALPFTSTKWTEYWDSKGCVPLDTQKTVSMDRLAPGESPPPPPPKPTKEQVKAQQAEENRQKLLEQKIKKPALANDKPAEKPTTPDSEKCENPPVFDMLDIPDAMEKLKWPVSAKIARKWFSSAKHVYNDKPNSIQPIDDTSVTLDWVLKFGNVKDKMNQLLAKNIYSENAVTEAKAKVSTKLKDVWINQKSSSLSFNTTSSVGDSRQHHMDWQFQLEKISTLDTCNGFITPTDLTGALGSFAIYVSIGNVLVYGDKYYIYDNKNRTKTCCFEPQVEITHVHVYVRDNYSFNDGARSKKSQYLGHWNKTGFIVTEGGGFSDVIDGRYVHSDYGNSPSQKNLWGYLMNTELDKPVDRRMGLLKKFREQDVYFPIYNKSYREWREKHNRGGDLMLYSKAKYMKLKKPIKFTVETLCRQPEKM